MPATKTRQLPNGRAILWQSVTVRHDERELDVILYGIDLAMDACPDTHRIRRAFVHYESDRGGKRASSRRIFLEVLIEPRPPN